MQKKDITIYFLSLASVAISLANCENKRVGPSPEKYEKGSTVAKIGGPNDPALNANNGKDTLKSRSAGLGAGNMEHDSTPNVEYSTDSASKK